VVSRRRWPSKRILASLGLAAGTAVVALLAFQARGTTSDRTSGVTLTDRRQITFNGHVDLPAISGNGKTLAYRTANCGPAGCTFGIEVKDIDGATSRRLFDGGITIRSIGGSPGSRHPLFG